MMRNESRLAGIIFFTIELLRGVFLHLKYGDYDHIRCLNCENSTIFGVRGSILALHDYFALAKKIDFSSFARHFS